MTKLVGFPKNKEKYVRLLEFFGEVLEICEVLGVTPILDGSLAVFAYTKNPDMEINDVDTSISEIDFSKVIKILREKGITYKLKEWGVLQVWKEDLKIELGSAERYLKDMPNDYEDMEIAGYKIKMLSLKTLTTFYKQSMDERAKSDLESDKVKYERLKSRYELLLAISHD